MSEVWFRLALVIAALGIVGAFAATELPTKPDGLTCGTWIKPEWSGPDYEQVKDVEFGGIGAQAQAAHRTCDDALTTRRNLALVSAGIAFAGPLALMFISGATRREEEDE